LLRDTAVSAGLVLSATMQTISNSLDWFAFNWTRTSFPVPQAFQMFFTVHGVQGEQAPGQAQGGDHVLGGRNFVALLCHRQVSENDLPVGGKGAHAGPVTS
jgi:hypothetical protein